MARQKRRSRPRANNTVAHVRRNRFRRRNFNITAQGEQNTRNIKVQRRLESNYPFPSKPGASYSGGLGTWWMWLLEAALYIGLQIYADLLDAATSNILRKAKHEETVTVNGREEKKDVPTYPIISSNPRASILHPTHVASSFLIGFDELVSADDSLITPVSIADNLSYWSKIDPNWTTAGYQRNVTIDGVAHKTKYGSAATVKYSQARLKHFMLSVRCESSVLATSRIWVGFCPLTMDSTYEAGTQTILSSGLTLDQIQRLPYVISFDHNDKGSNWKRLTWKPRRGTFWADWHSLGMCANSDTTYSFSTGHAGYGSMPFVRVYVAVECLITRAVSPSMLSPVYIPETTTLSMELSGSITLRGSASKRIIRNHIFSPPVIQNKVIVNGDVSKKDFQWDRDYLVNKGVNIDELDYDML